MRIENRKLEENHPEDTLHIFRARFLREKITDRKHLKNNYPGMDILSVRMVY